MDWFQWVSPGFFLSSRWPAECPSHQGAAADALRLAVWSCSGHGQIRPGGEHQHLGAPHGEHHAVAAAAGQHPDQQGKHLPRVRDENLGTEMLTSVIFMTFSASCFLQPTSTGMTLTDLPASLQLNIMQCLSDGRDLVSLGQVCPELGALTEDRLLWKRLCQYHFTDRQARRD